MTAIDLTAVRRFAWRAHEGQRYGELPYTAHLEAVVATLERFDYRDPAVLAAAWLHDCVEDCGVPLDDIHTLAGPRVAALVDAVTDAPGKNREARKEKPYRLIPETPGAILVKLADRISNVEASLETRPGLVRMYRKEQKAFRERLHRSGEAEPMWRHLERLLR